MTTLSNNAAISSLPEDLTAADRWVLHRSKVPYQVANPRKRASSTDPATWGSFVDACSVAHDADGIGFVLGDGIVGIDIDNAIDDQGHILPEAQQVLDALPQTYTEVSPSGRGLHAFARGVKPTRRCRVELGNGAKLEVYESGRYFTVTGQRWGNSPSTIADDDLAGVCSLLPGYTPVVASSESVASSRSSDIGGFHGSDDDLLEAARMAKNGALFVALFDHGELGSYSHDRSRADLALCSMLAYWTGNDRVAIDRLFRRSALMRDKWNRDDYRERTIHKAIADSSQSHRIEPERPCVRLPSVDTEIIESANDLALLLASEDYYSRGSDCRFARIRNHKVELLNPSQARSIFERVAVLGVSTHGEGEQAGFRPKRCTKDMAEAIMASDPFHEGLPPLNSLMHCPVLLSDGTIVTGYHRPTGIYALGKTPQRIELDEARALLLDLLNDFAFVTRHDMARAMAAILTPAMAYGQLLGARKRCPAVCWEADQSQAGKGYAVRLIAAIFGTVPQAVGLRRGGVGGVEESIGRHLISGSPFIVLDNLRGQIDLPWLELALTEPQVDCRIPYRGGTSIDPSRTAWAMTSNKAELTPDLANRSLLIRIEKQSEGYEFTSYPEGDLIDHVVAHQSRYLGAVFAVIKEWLDRGKPGKTDARHDMRHWAGAIKWIVGDLLGLGDPFIGHRDLQRRTSGSSECWLREVAHAVDDAGRLDIEVNTNEILSILLEANVDVPGMKPIGDLDDEQDRGNGLRGIGRRLNNLFNKRGAGDGPMVIDSYSIARMASVDPTDCRRQLFTYCFRKIASPQDS